MKNEQNIIKYTTKIKVKTNNHIACIIFYFLKGLGLKLCESKLDATNKLHV